jgi:DNA end-binding protein Ku
MAKKLIDGMTTKWDPDKYEDDYKTQLMTMIKEKVKHPTRKQVPPKTGKKPSNIIDLMSVLQESLSHAKPARTKAHKTKVRARTGKSRQRQAA